MKKINILNNSISSAVSTITGGGNSTWGANEHSQLAAALVADMADESGNKVNLNPAYAEIAMALLSPSDKNRSRALDAVFQLAGYELEHSTKQTFELLLNMPDFAKHLASKGLVKKGAKKGKKAAFDALLGGVSSENQGLASAA